MTNATSSSAASDLHEKAIKSTINAGLYDDLNLPSGHPDSAGQVGATPMKRKDPMPLGLLQNTTGTGSNGPLAAKPGTSTTNASDHSTKRSKKSNKSVSFSPQPPREHTVPRWIEETGGSAIKASSKELRLEGIRSMGGIVLDCSGQSANGSQQGGPSKLAPKHPIVEWASYNNDTTTQLTEVEQVLAKLRMFVKKDKKLAKTLKVQLKLWAGYCSCAFSRQYCLFWLLHPV